MSKKYIKVGTDVKELAEKTFGVSRTIIDLALSYKRNGETAQKVRRFVMNHGGILYIESADWEKEI